MTMYRAVTTNLTRIGVKRGEMFPDKKLTPEAAKILLEKGVISVVAAPPVEAVPELKPAAKKLKKAKIEKVDEIIEAKEIEGVEKEELEELQDIATKALTVEDEDGCSNCS